MEGPVLNLRTYRAHTVEEALSAIRADFGDDALIIETRSMRAGGFLGFGRRTVVEITAGLPPVQAPDAARERGAPDGRRGAAPEVTRTTSVTAGVAARAYRSTTAQGFGAADAAMNGAREKPIPQNGSGADTVELVTDEDRARTRELARLLLERHERNARVGVTPTNKFAGEEGVAGGPNTTARSPVSDPRGRVSTHGAGVTPERGVVDHDARPRRFLLVDSDANGAAPELGGRGEEPQRHAGDRVARAHGGSNGTSSAECRPVGAASHPNGPVAEPARSSAASDEIRDELAALRALVTQVIERQAASAHENASSGGALSIGAPALRQAGEPDGATPAVEPTRHPQLEAFYRRLLEQELSRELAERVMSEVQSKLSAASLADPARVRAAVIEALETLIPVAEATAPAPTTDGRPFTLALIGPTGVGKTTTLAKLAAAFKLRHHRRVGLITCDTYRIAAIDQLRTYAAIIDVPLHVASTPEQLQRACERMRDLDVILIDTAGRSQNDASRLDELGALLSAARPHEVHLVLAGTAGERVLEREAKAFGALGVDRVVLTKLDEAVSFGILVGTMHHLGKAVSYITMGQEVPDHIEPARPRRLAELVLDGEMTNA